jgi:hypothetical protein
MQDRTQIPALRKPETKRTKMHEDDFVMTSFIRRGGQYNATWPKIIGRKNK